MDYGRRDSPLEGIAENRAEEGIGAHRINFDSGSEMGSEMGSKMGSRPGSEPVSPRAGARVSQHCSRGPPGMSR